LRCGAGTHPPPRAVLTCFAHRHHFGKGLFDEGDRVLRIDGRGVESLPLIEARSELKDARCKSVRLIVQDGARTREVVVKLRDLV
jgi:hypothetical protein